MNQQEQSEIELKLQAFEKLGDNPTEVDIKYVSYLFKIPPQTVRQWLEEKAGIDFQIEISPAEDMECQMIGCIMKKKQLVNQQDSVKEEDIINQQINNSFKQQSTQSKENQAQKKKKKVEKTKQSNTNKKNYKALQKQVNQVIKQINSTSNEDCKTQEQNIQVTNQELTQQNQINDDSSKLNNNIILSSNKDNSIQQQIQITKQHIQKEKKLNQQFNQKKKQIYQDKQKNQKEIIQKSLVEQSNPENKAQQSKCLIIIDDDVNLKNQITANTSQSLNKLIAYDKQQNLQDLTHLKKKKTKNPSHREIQMECNKPENGVIKQSEQKQRQNQIKTNLFKQNLQNTQHIQFLQNVESILKQKKQDSLPQQISQQQLQQQQQQQQQQYSNLQNGNQNQILNFSGQSSDQILKQKYQAENKSHNNQFYNVTQPLQKKDQNLNKEFLNILQNQTQQQPNYLALACSNQATVPQMNSMDNGYQNHNQLHQTTIQKQQNQENLLKKQNSIGVDFQNDLNQSLQKNNMEKQQQQPYQFDLVQMFDQNSQVLVQAVQLMNTFSNYQVALMDKLEMIYECVNKN